MFYYKLFFLSFAFSFLTAKPAKDIIDISHYGDELFGLPKEEVGKAVSEWSPDTSEVNPEELGPYLEGDILVPKYSKETKNGVVAFSSKWDAAIVPYVIIGPYSTQDEDMIHKAIKAYHDNTCIRFRRKQPDDVDYIKIVNSRTGCWSSVGKIGGGQEVNLQSPGCLSTLGTPVHELMHAVGFHHEQSRFERDSYVDIMWNNIKTGHENNFSKVPKGTTTGYGVNYDYESVMHYSAYAFSVNQRPTIVPKNSRKKIGQRDGFSVGDITKIRNMYNCTMRTETENKDNNNPLSSFVSGIQSFINSIG